MVFLLNTAFAQLPDDGVDNSSNPQIDNITELTKQAERHFLKGEYNKSIEIYDSILEKLPAEAKILNMKGIALNNLRLQITLAAQDRSTVQYDPLKLNERSMMVFYNVLQINPNNVIALNGLGLGFGNFAEYNEAKKYLNNALKIEPNNFVSKNYLNYIEKIEKKYPVQETEKPLYLLKLEENKIPHWIKSNASWWASGKINDTDFISGIEYLVKNKIIKVNSQTINQESSDTIPPWIKNNAKWWASGLIPDEDFLGGIKYLIENSIINISDNNTSEIAKKEFERTLWNFQRYLKEIQMDIKNEKRYIEYPNPSADVIKKFWKDYNKWNLEQFMLIKLFDFPDREVILVDDVYYIKYNVFVNQQPPGLPLDHVSTLQNSFDFWHDAEFTASDGKKAIIEFQTVNTKADANVWVTWVVRNLGEGILGHATLGKGVVEVALGGYGCDGSFQLFTVNTIEVIMTHELGHSIGLGHVDDPENMMHSSIAEANYAYCLLT